MISKLLQPVQQFVEQNTTTILTGVGVVGVAGTAVLTGTATIKAVQLIDGEYADRVEKRFASDNPPDLGQTADPLSSKEKLILAGPQYVPAVVCGVATMTAIIFAHRLSAKEAAALAAAYSLSDRAFADYKAKVQEKLGMKKEEEVRVEVAHDVAKQLQQPIIIDGSTQVLCFDVYSGRYFKSTAETIRKAVNDVNASVLTDMSCDLSDYYGRVGLDKTGYSDAVGWSNRDMLDVDIMGAVTEEGQPYLIVDFSTNPVPMSQIW